MHKFIKKRSKILKLFLVLSFCAVTVSAMEVVVPIKDVGTFTKKEYIGRSRRCSSSENYTISIFDPQDAFKKGIMWDDIVPKNIKVTSDSKGIIIVKPGQVWQCLFDEKENAKPKIIIEHIAAKRSIPLIVMAQKENNPLVIISACNYVKKECAAECIVLRGDLLKKIIIDMPLQAISSDADGKKLVVAGKHRIRVIDLETDESAETDFKGLYRDGSWILDVAMSPDGKSVLAAANQNSIRWFSVSRSEKGIKLEDDKHLIAIDDIHNLYSPRAECRISNIYYPNARELFYLGLDKIVKSITIDDLFKTNNERAVTNDFVQLSEGDVFFADHQVIAQACWPTNQQSINKKFDNKEIKKDNSLISLKVFRKPSQNYEDQEEFDLEMFLPQARYNYITEYGQSHFGIDHLLYIAVGKDHVVALATDGKLRVWELPGKNKEIKIEKLDLDSLSSPKQQKEARSSKDRLHSPRNKKVLTSSDKGDKSPRDKLIQNIKKTTGSRDGSPVHGKNDEKK